MNKISDDLGKIIEKAGGSATRQVGSTKTDNQGRTLVWTETKPGKFDWRIAKNQPKKEDDSDEDDSDGQFSKLQNHLKNSTVDSLKAFAKKPGNAPKLRQAAYDELVERGEDVSDIDLNTGKYGQMKQAFGVGNGKSNFKLNADGSSTSSEDAEDEDWKDPEFIRKKFGFNDFSKATKSQRIAYDKFVTEQKAKDPNYLPPEEEIYDLNTLYAQFLMTDSPLMIASGGAGVGKTHNLHLVAKAMNKKPFDPDVDQPGDDDYDYVEAPEVNSAPQLASLLKEHNGKIIVFDDTDNLLKSQDTFGILKKATASSGKRIVGKKSAGAGNIDPFEFKGKIIFLTNMNQAQLTKDENLNAIYSRALKKDIYFTKQEQLHFIDKLKHQFNFTGIDRLPNKADDIQEREEIFTLLKDNIEDIDPAKFNVRSMKEMLEVKRASDRAEEFTKNDPVMGKMLFGNAGDWKKKVKTLLVKGEGYNPKKEVLEKAKEILNLE
jgi:hypothetical protein